MNPADLRIGNWIMTPTGYAIVDYITMQKGVYVIGHLPTPISSGYGHGTCKVRECHPVELTSDILLTSGFFKVFTSRFIFWKNIQYVSNSISISEDLKKFVIFGNKMPNTGVQIRTIKYVHELQNLYYFVEGEEILIYQLK